MEYTTRWINKPEAENMLHYNNMVFVRDIFYYCAGVCNIHQQASNPRLSESQLNCLATCGTTMSEVRQNYLEAFNEHLASTDLPDQIFEPEGEE